MTSLVVCGAINRDTTYFVEHLPAPGEEVRATNVTIVPGGTGGNAADAAARILDRGQVAMLGAVGDDEIAGQQVATFHSEGILTEGITRLAGEKSGQAYVVVDRQGQNIIASYPGANTNLHPGHLDKAETAYLLQTCRGIVLTDPPLPVANKLIDMAKTRKIPVLWDPGILICPDQNEQVFSLAKKADIVFLNETEAKALLKSENTAAILQWLREKGFHSHIVLKQGARGAILLEPTRNAITEVPALPLTALSLNMTNSAGCGDTFLGVFAAYYIEEPDLQKALIMASVAAGINATKPETRGCPGRIELEAVERRSRQLGFTFRRHQQS